MADKDASAKTYIFSPSYDVPDTFLHEDDKESVTRFKAVAKSVCRIEVANKVGALIHVGTGFLQRIDGDGPKPLCIVLTASHVAERLCLEAGDRPRTKMWVNFSTDPDNDGDAQRLRILKSKPYAKYDVGVLFFQDSSNLPEWLFRLPRIELTESIPRTDVSTFVIGYPGHGEHGDKAKNVLAEELRKAQKLGRLCLSAGTVVGAEAGKSDFYHNAATLPGNSGSPIFNKNAKLLGLHFAANDRGNRALSNTLLNDVLESVEQPQQPPPDPHPQVADIQDPEIGNIQMTLMYLVCLGSIMAGAGLPPAKGDDAMKLMANHGFFANGCEKLLKLLDGLEFVPNDFRKTVRAYNTKYRSGQ
eukprot:m.43946 g.43946  ORF g.43946 m.43946 type:complete len:359 (-) comp12277_c0_seq1:224-1300(-)